ncbi:FtsX-like permease family protein [Schumannella sp. 10F1B-5-1]|uniref:FtsX-like permease family protein n=1 Tax=Schumannella sp. 10F1B-5-1 TaxID=2590780 RepID=UPI0011326A0D|nr:FtsX-like permease family protein [Schumannella sp. 10F1B-5-1]TPW76903.1 FtsX-like permease family protein [Schumannella sp. 10F1B-5-1]
MIARLTWMLARPGRAGLGLTLLPIVAFAVVTTLLLTVIGGAQTLWTLDNDLQAIYQLLTVVALALLVVPLLSLGGAAARLAARRRDDRLATLRLLGASSGTVGAVAVLESGALALAGALLGGVLSLAVAPLVGLIPFAGAPLGAANVLVSPWGVVLVVAGIVLVAILSAVLGLRRVVLSPLGVRMRSDAPKQGWIAVAVGVLGIAGASFASSVLGAAGSVVVMIVLAGAAFAGALALMNLVGPWLIAVVARRRVRSASTPERLLAARVILESPKAAWRQVSASATAAFVAVFAGTGAALLNLMNAGDLRDQDALLALDIRTGVIVTVVGTFLMVACAVGVTQAATILDRAEVSRSLGHLGVPLAVIERARVGTVLVPLLTTSITSAVVAAVVVLPLAGLALVLAPVSVGMIVAALLAGLGLVLLGLLATRPLQSRALATEPRVAS